MPTVHGVLSQQEENRRSPTANERSRVERPVPPVRAEGAPSVMTSAEVRGRGCAVRSGGRPPGAVTGVTLTAGQRTPAALVRRTRTFFAASTLTASGAAPSAPHPAHSDRKSK